MPITFDSAWRERIRTAASTLAAAGVASPEYDAREIAEHVLSNDADASSFAALIARRARREPLQHLLGTMWFRYLELVSRPGAFIVRPETEMVAQAGIDVVGAGSVVVDLCTGSGAIALAIATEKPGTKVIAVEQSAEAYAVAQENNARYGSPVEIRHDDALTACADLLGAVDLVITNPPYVPLSEELSAEVRHDPAMALFGGGPDGLELPYALVERSAKLLRPRGILIMEHGDDQAAALRTHALAHGFASARTGRDLTGRDRWLEATMKNDASNAKEES